MISGKHDPKESARDAESDVKTKQIEVECEQEDRVLAIAARSEAVPFSIYVIHQAATRWHRKEIGAAAKKVIADTGDKQVDLEATLRRAEDMSEVLEQAFMDKNCGRDKIPVFDWDLHTNDE